MKELCILKGARELISDPTHWTQGVLARYSSGEKAYSTMEPDAVSWCSLGAMSVATSRCGATAGQMMRSWGILEKFCPDGNISEFNDTHTHAEVLAAFDAAILAASTDSQDASSTGVAR